MNNVDFRELSLYGAFLQGIKANRNGNCIISMNKKFKYSFVLDQIDKTAAILCANGVKQGDIITVVLPNIPQTEYIIYGANKIGAVIHLIHAGSTKEQIENNILKTESKFVFVMDAIANSIYELLKKYKVKVFSVCPIGSISIIKSLIYKKKYKISISTPIIDFDKELRTCAKFNNIPAIDKDLHATSVLFNGSGTNGVSNTIQLSDYALNSVCGLGLNMVEVESAVGKYMCSFLPFFHPFGFTVCMHLANCFGACNTLIMRFNMDEIMKYIKRGKMNYLVGVPTAFRGFLGHKKFNGKMLRKIDASFVGGDLVPHSLIDDFDLRMIENGSKNRLYQCYGPSETAAATCMNKPNANKHYTCGKPLSCTKYRIFDEEKQKLKLYGRGELYIGGDSLFNGYFKADEANKDCTYYDENGERYLKSGDIMEIDSEGYVTFVSRIKRVVKVSGFSIFPSEIEQVAMRVPGVNKVCAIGVPNEKTGHKIILYYETNNNSDELKNELKEYLRKHLEPKAIPQEIIYINRIPVTPITKIDAIALRKIYDKTFNE